MSPRQTLSPGQGTKNKDVGEPINKEKWKDRTEGKKGGKEGREEGKEGKERKKTLKFLQYLDSAVLLPASCGYFFISTFLNWVTSIVPVPVSVCPFLQNQFSALLAFNKFNTLQEQGGIFFNKQA